MYQGFNRWLSKELSWWKMPYYVVLAAMSIWACNQLALFLLYGSSGIAMSVMHHTFLSFVSSWDFWSAHFPVFVKEEMAFRAPLFLVAFIPPLIIPGILLFSGIFGWLHGDLTNLAIQGVSGVILCMMFLKFGGLQRNAFKGLKGLTASTATHTLFMFSLWAYVRL